MELLNESMGGGDDRPSSDRVIKLIENAKTVGTNKSQKRCDCDKCQAKREEQQNENDEENESIPPNKRSRFEDGQLIIENVELEADSAFLDDFVARLTGKRTCDDKPNVTQKEIEDVICQAKKEILAEPMLLRIKPPVNMCGDIHGQFEDLVRIFKKGGCLPGSKYLFLGDYVDRGDKSVEVISLLLAYKARYPSQIHLLRGNHESSPVNKRYSFYTECTGKFSKKLYSAFSDIFNNLPAAAVVGEKIFCVHGGLSPGLKDVNQILSIRRPSEIPARGLLCDLLWADPSEHVEGFDKNTDRGISYIFGEQAIADFLCNNNLELICRAHEVAMKGYKFYKKKQQLVTLFSAPKYDGYNNKGAIMVVSSNLTVTFQTLS